MTLNILMNGQKSMHFQNGSKTMTELFDKRFVHFMWDDALKGNPCFVADDIATLRRNVLQDTGRALVFERMVMPREISAFPFETASNHYRFAYYDPNYIAKRFYMEGKQIQYKYQGEGEGEWNDCVGTPDWCDNVEYRIKPEPRRMTRRQLAEWLAKGNGEVKCGDTVLVDTKWCYDIADTDKEVSTGPLIRRWDSDEWIVPTLAIYEEDCIHE